VVDPGSTKKLVPYIPETTVNGNAIVAMMLSTFITSFMLFETDDMYASNVLDIASL